MDVDAGERRLLESAATANIETTLEDVRTARRSV